MSSVRLETYASLLEFVAKYSKTSLATAAVSASASSNQTSGEVKQKFGNAFEIAVQKSPYEELKKVPLLSATRVEGGWRDILCPKGLLEGWYTSLHQPRPPKLDSDGEADKEKVKEAKRLLREQTEKEARELYSISIPGLDAVEWTEVKPLPVSKFPKLMGHVKRMEALNSVIRDGSPLLKAFKEAIASGMVKRLLAFDVEAYEHDQKHLLELGVAIYDMPTGTDLPVIEAHHFIMAENRSKKNGRYCADNRDKFSFGKSCTWPITKVFNWLHDQLKVPGTALLGHALHGDLAYLCQARMYKPQKAGSKPLKHAQPSGTFAKFSRDWLSARMAFDTQAIFKEVHLREREDRLESILRYYGLTHAYLHNAGNDAYYTLVSGLKLAELPYCEDSSDGKRKIQAPTSFPKKTSKQQKTS